MPPLKEFVFAKSKSNLTKITITCYKLEHAKNVLKRIVKNPEDFQQINR